MVQELPKNLSPKSGAKIENQEKLKRLFVDVGFGFYPVVDYGNRKFGDDEIYLGLDLSTERVHKLSEKHKDNPRVQFKKVEGGENEFYFPLPNGVASEVHIGNVFGIPGAVDSHNLALVLEEAVRVLKEGGTLSILEDLTPNYTKDYFTNVILKGYPLRVVLSIDSNSSEWEEGVAEYDNLGLSKSPWGEYLIKAEKITETKS